MKKSCTSNTRCLNNYFVGQRAVGKKVAGRMGVGKAAVGKKAVTALTSTFHFCCKSKLLLAQNFYF
jgi:hypothetical protein